MLYKHVGLTTSTYIAIPAVAPIALGVFYSYNGMSFMEMMKRKLHFAFGNRALTYISRKTKALLMIITSKWRLRQIKWIKEKELNN